MDTDGAEEKLDELTEFLGNKYEEAVCELDEELRPKRRDENRSSIVQCDNLQEIRIFESLPFSQVLSKTSFCWIRL